MAPKKAPAAKAAAAAPTAEAPAKDPAAEAPAAEPPKDAAKAKDAKKKDPAAAATNAAEPQPTGAAASGPAPPEGSYEAVIAALDWDGLPNREGAEKAVLNEFKTHGPHLMSAFVFYCKNSSECTTLDSATKLHLAGLRKIMSHVPHFETPMFPGDNIVRVFGKVAAGSSELPATAKEVAPTTVVDLKTFLSFCLQVAFYRGNPRYGIMSTQAAPKEGAAPKKEPEVAPVQACLKAFMAEVLGKMHKLTNQHFNDMLAKDRSVQQVRDAIETHAHSHTRTPSLTTHLTTHPSFSLSLLLFRCTRSTRPSSRGGTRRSSRPPRTPTAATCTRRRSRRSRRRRSSARPP